MSGLPAVDESKTNRRCIWNFKTKHKLGVLLGLSECR